ncbi:MAG TPA: TIGR04551 family protein [Polyangia bacterium]|jgi:uncharacterized protein (TIGR04551 family)
MSRLRSLLVLLAIAVAAPAAAQMPPGGMGPGGGGRPAPKPEEEKEEGQAEQAPPSSQEEPTLQPIPSYPGQAERELQFLELHGYFRLRTDYFRSFNLGFKETRFPPFPTPICSRTLTGDVNPQPSSNIAPVCGDSAISDANMRFRLEPTLNISEHVRIRAQIDMLDNLILGSTPESYASGQVAPGNAPLGSFSTTQVPPIAGRNSFGDSIMVKRVWGEVRLPVGELRFGRMPSQWGLGLLANDGSCLDCDQGSTSDRVLFATRLADHMLGVGYGWINDSMTQMQTSTWLNRYQGQGYNLDTKWGTSEWLVVGGKIDKPAEWKERVQRGDVAINYGTYQVFRLQETDLAFNSKVPLGQSDTPGGSGGLRDIYVKRNAFAWIPDVWFKLTYKGLDLELEALYIYGNIDNATDISPKLDHGLRIRQWGGVVRSQYRFLADALRVGLEVGTASGDSTENANIPYLDYRYEFNPPIVGDNVNGKLHFNPDYHVDEILWRRIYGTVSNATYFKPSIAYDIVESFGGRLDVIYSLANKPVATPGNSINYGLEIDVNLGYHNDDEGFFAGVTYGVLFPFAALDHPATVDGQSLWGTTYAGSSHAAQVLRFWLGIKF